MEVCSGLTITTVSANIRNMIPQDILKLKPSERLELVEDIWDSLTDLPDTIPFTPAQKTELDRRIAKYRSNPHGGIPWGEVKDRILLSV